ncbi:fungal-specific transcription factor domain-containing protein [Dactylonectria macrodidyma]|uniref:Fungal-specific transcription factor domain-containing protein n=1 Tax=Dactylonectria macrodidyma TaxID=307937 RepID=A0A9P9ERW6_9HYPO|nr:fungal-specific transcription factor domain-containing protein [Dactylonectria macrodidyma]
MEIAADKSLSPRHSRGNEAAKPSKACVPCRARKVKCDAARIGRPCSSCIGRQCTESCVLSTRKRRSRTTRRSDIPTQRQPRQSRNDVSTGPHKEYPEALASTPGHAIDSSHSGPTSSSTDTVNLTNSSNHHENPRALDYQGHSQYEPDLQYINILQDAVNSSPTGPQPGPFSSTPQSPRPKDGLTSQIRLWNSPPQLANIDREFLSDKGVFDLPPRQYGEVLLETYFKYVHPFGPVVRRVDFVRNYREGRCSLFVLYAMFAASVIFVSEDAVAGCGFDNCSTAQTTFFSKAKLLHDFQYESDPLSMLQGSIILGVVILDQPTDKDFQYWFYNSTRLAVKLDLHSICQRGNASSKFGIYRRMWWVLYTRDVFHSFVNTRNLRLLRNDFTIEPITEEDWEDEEIPEGFGLLQPVSYWQKMSFIAHGNLAQIIGDCLSTMSKEIDQDPRHLMPPLDAWRESLAEKMHSVGSSQDAELYYAELLATSYRFEAIMCRLLQRRWRSRDADRSEWAKQRLRSATFELDTIAGRILTNGSILRFPMSFITTMPAVLALHVESALDHSETEIIRSMSFISISRTMLILEQLRHIPAIKRGLPIFELVLSKKKLWSPPPAHTERESPSSASVQDNRQEVSDTQIISPASEPAPGDKPMFLGDFLGFDFLDRWEIEQFDYTAMS